MKFRDLAAVAVLALIPFGCGQVKTADDKVLTVQGDSAAAPQSARGQKLDKSVADLAAFWKLYSKDGGNLSEGEFANLYAKYKDKLLAFLSGSKLSANDMLDLILALNSGRGGVGPIGADETLTSRFPFLRWIPDNVTEVSLEELYTDVGKEYPDSSPWARQGLAQTLLEYDRPWAGGNANGRVGRVELSGIGLILGFVADTDFTNFQPQPGDDPMKALMIETINGKLDQELYGRAPVLYHQSLSASDNQMQWMDLSARFWLTDRLVHTYSKTGLLALNAPQTAEALSQLGPNQVGHWQKLRALYDNKMMGGDGNGSLNTVEAFSLLADLDLAVRVGAATGGDVSAAGVNRMAPAAKKQLLDEMQVILPRTGQSLAIGDLLDPWNPLAIRNQFWDSLKLYDKKDYGGDDNGHIDAGELAMGLAYCRLTENLFALYDKDQNGLMTKDEARVMFHELAPDMRDERFIDAFFADVGLDGHDPSFWREVQMFFGGGGAHIDRLGPFEFYARLVKVLPRFLYPHEHREKRKGD
jgi:hypothetical protein